MLVNYIQKSSCNDATRFTWQSICTRKKVNETSKSSCLPFEVSKVISLLSSHVSRVQEVKDKKNSSVQAGESKCCPRGKCTKSCARLMQAHDSTTCASNGHLGDETHVWLLHADTTAAIRILDWAASGLTTSQTTLRCRTRSTANATRLLCLRFVVVLQKCFYFCHLAAAPISTNFD